MAWQLDAQNIAGLLEGAEGEISASGSIKGTTGQPRVQVELGGENLRLDTYGIDLLKATLVAGLAPADPLELALDINGLEDGESQLLTALSVRAAGTTGQHRLTARLASGEAQLRARLDGGADTQLSAWQGRLSELDADTADFGQWSLDGAAALSLASDRASLGESCLQAASGPGSICAAGDWAAEGDSAGRLKLQALPLDLFVPAITSTIDGSLDAGLSAGGELRAQGLITLGGGTVEVDESRSLTHGGGELGLRIDTSGLLADVQLATPEQGTLEALVRLPAMSSLPMAEAQPLAGTIKAEMPDLSGFAAWVPELERSAGRLGADLKLGGTLETPRLEGTLALQDGAATVPLAGLALQDIQLQVASDPSRPGKLSLSGGARSGAGEIKLQGEADLDDSSMALTLNGDRFEIYNTADARAVLSPDLQIAWADNILKLRGQVTIPQADITPKIKLSPAAQDGGSSSGGAPGEAILPSADVVVISETIEVAPEADVPTAPFRIDSQLRLQLGEKVRVKAVGFVSRITGAVDFTNTPEQEALIPIANGRFSLKEGTFRSFGQDLEIETGHVIFDNVPATEPELNLRAVRWIDNDPQVTAAGVMVTGPLDQPVLELFSRPQLETSEIQSYLLTGRSPRSRDSVLGIGTYVTRKIYVGYGFNMLERTSEFNSLFNISPRYGVGSSVGEADNNINMTITYEH
jgi:autotransporter translocation and assembly factor TamB